MMFLQWPSHAPSWSPLILSAPREFISGRPFPPPAWSLLPSLLIGSNPVFGLAVKALPTLTLAGSISHCPFKTPCAALIRPCFLLQATPLQLGPHELPRSPVSGSDSGLPPGGHKVSYLHSSSGRSSPASTASCWSSTSALGPQWLPVSPEPSAWHRQGPFVKEAHVYS